MDTCWFRCCSACRHLHTGWYQQDLLPLLAGILRWGQSRTGGSSKHIKRKSAGEVHQNSPPADLKSDQDHLPSVVLLWSNEKSPPIWRWFFSKWWTWSDSNRRPLQCECSALPTALQAHIAAFCGIFATKSRFSSFSILEDLRGNPLRNHGLKLTGRCAAIGMRTQHSPKLSYEPGYEICKMGTACGQLS